MYVYPTPVPADSGLPGIQHATIAGERQGLSRVAVWQQVLEAGSATPPHRHDCEEVVLCHAGRGELHIDGKVHVFGAGCTLTIPADMSHQIINTGSSEMQLLAAFSTAHVDARFPDGERIALPWQADGAG